METIEQLKTLINRELDRQEIEQLDQQERVAESGLGKSTQQEYFSRSGNINGLRWVLENIELLEYMASEDAEQERALRPLPKYETP